MAWRETYRPGSHPDQNSACPAPPRPNACLPRRAAPQAMTVYPTRPDWYKHSNQLALFWALLAWIPLPLSCNFVNFLGLERGVGGQQSKPDSLRDGDCNNTLM